MVIKMKVDKKRLFVGNLPPSSTEDALNKKFKKYGNVISVELKKRADGSTFAFLDFETNTKDLALCLNEFQRKTWDGHEIKVELAKESFLSRLTKERESVKNNSAVSPSKSKQLNGWENKSAHENIVLSTKPLNSSREPSEEDGWRKKQKHSEVFNNECSDVARENGRKSKSNHRDLSSSKRFDFSEENEEHEERKGNIPMFRGILSVDVNKTETNNSVSEVDLLRRFESFSDVWKDDPCDDTDEIKGNKNLHKSEIKQQTFGLKKSIEISDNFNKHGKSAADERRLKSIAERKKLFQQRKQIISSALTKIDTSVRNSKKIILDPDVEDRDAASFSKQVVVDRKFSQTTESSPKKEKLFSDGESEDESDDFKIKSQFEGQKGQKLLALQARYANDKRFTLDERFYESEDNDEEATPKEEEPTDEKKKQLQILGNILGQELVAPADKYVKQKRKSMLRFDPTKPDHVKYEVKQTPNESEEQGSRLDERSSKKKKFDKAAAVEPIPAVSKDKYYEVSDTLKESLKNKNDKFSLLDMFGSEDVKDADETYQDAELKGPKSKKQMGWSMNPFKYDSSESEEETEQNTLPIKETAHTHQSMWHESFFFAPDDVRLQQGMQFLSRKNENNEDFAAKRRELKQIIRGKVRNNQKKKMKWKKKLGGKRQPRNNLDRKRKQTRA